MNKSKIITVLVTGAIIVGGILYFMKDKKNTTDNTVVENNTATSTTVVLDGNGGVGYKVEAVPVESNKKVIPVPDLNRKIVFSSDPSLTTEVKEMAKNKILNFQAELKKDSKNIENWISLGLYQKMIGDYNGAAISWKYAADISNDYVSLGNLGNLYVFYLKDNAMGENYYQLAIKRDPKQSYLYVQLAEVYRDAFGDIIKARKIIDEGLVKLPNNPSLLDMKKNLQ